MLKKFIFLLSLLFVLPVNAGEMEKALDRGENVFLYLYTKPCKYCILFTPRYEKIIKVHDKDFSYFKIDAKSEYGMELMQNFGAQYVPYVVLMNKSKHKAMNIHPSCLLDNVCIESKITEFKK